VLLNYNLLFGMSWSYAMKLVVSLVFHCICFLHEGRIVTIEQVTSKLSKVTTNIGSIVSYIENSQSETESISYGMYPSLMGYFYFFVLISYIRATPVGYQNSSPYSFTLRVT
jgi:hypothetical protein